MRTTARRSCSTYSQSPDSALPMLSTTSISVAPSRHACSVSNRFTAVALLPCGKPTTVPTATPLPRRSVAAILTA